jgi:hypothetical protein
MTPTTDIEVLGPALSRSETLGLERHATKLYETGQRTVVQFAADLYKLQEGQAHILRGFTNFGEYASTRFEGLGAVNAMQIARQGRVLLVLEKAGRINIDKGENLPGTTGLRALAKILKDLGADTMVAIHDRAALSGKVTDERVAAATAELIAPQVHELGAGVDEAPTEDDEDEDEENGYDDDKMPPKVRELIEYIRDLSWELPGSAEDITKATERLKDEIANADTSEDSKWIESKR